MQNPEAEDSPTSLPKRAALARYHRARLADDFRTRLQSSRPYLVRYASIHLRSAEAVEDVVQDTLLAALAAEKSFAGRSDLRTWITGILKHKIIDAIRRSSRQRALDASDGEASVEDLDSLFDETGHWRDPPRDWPDPQDALQEKQFLGALEKCLAALPARTSRVFLMREHLGFETTEICKELGITSTHCWVLLYRARVALRQCLEKGWLSR